MAIPDAVKSKVVKTLQYEQLYTVDNILFKTLKFRISLTSLGIPLLVISNRMFVISESFLLVFVITSEMLWIFLTVSLEFKSF